MKTFLHFLLRAAIFFIGITFCLSSVAETSEATTLSEWVNSLFSPAVQYMEPVLFWDPLGKFGLDIGLGTRAPLIVIWFVAGALFFTFYLGFINLRGFRHSIDLVSKGSPSAAAKGEISYFSALSTALSGTVGLGNIAGVAIAISVGGAGATFWMILAGLLGMSTKFVECTLGVKYREIDKDGRVTGGPMLYLSRGLKEKGLPRLGKVLAISFCILCVLGSLGAGNMFQANQAFSQTQTQFTFLSNYGFWFGIVMAAIVGGIVIGGIKGIAQVTSRIVPFMCGIYVFFALIIIVANIHNIGDAFLQIITGAFGGDAIKGGAIGVLIIGFQRAAFSSEAGLGSSPIAHATARTEKPISEGHVALLEPFIDTVVICTMTALVLIFTGVVSPENAQLQGVQLTSAAFSSVFPWFKWVLIIIVIFFAFSTMLTWSYYGLNAWCYIFGRYGKLGYIKNTYIAIFLACIVIGASSDLGSVIDFSDMVVLSMAFPNIIGLFFLCKDVKKDLRDYQSRE